MHAISDLNGQLSNCHHFKLTQTASISLTGCLLDLCPVRPTEGPVVKHFTLFEESHVWTGKLRVHTNTISVLQQTFLINRIMVNPRSFAAPISSCEPQSPILLPGTDVGETSSSCWSISTTEALAPLLPLSVQEERWYAITITSRK